MFNRQRILLALIDRAGGTASRMALMKWAFILSHEGKSKVLDSFYQFVPYKYGPYSFNMVHEIENLMRNGFITNITKHKCSITRYAKKEIVKLEYSVIEDLNQLWRLYGRLPVSRIIEKLYKKYPWYSVNSNLDNKRKPQEIPKAEINVYTAGYAGLQIDGFLNLLLKAGIERVIDIRNKPVSRNYGFHKRTFSRLCSLLSMEYIHLSSLGVDSSKRKNLISASDYARLLKEYRDNVQENCSDEIYRVIELINEKPSVLVCQEEDEQYCHRSILADIISERLSLKIVELRNNHD